MVKREGNAVPRMLFASALVLHNFQARSRIEQYENRLVQMKLENDHYKQSVDELKVCRYQLSFSFI